ncbi:MAG: hypothetical protein V2A79_09790 [Planctomycetota bacterium]
MAAESIFPAETKDAETTYKQLVARGREARLYRKTHWSRTYAYIQGIRQLTLNFARGTVSATYTDKAGRLKFVYEELLAKYQTQLGRLLGMDLSPRVVRRNESLDGQRAAAIDQAVLGHSFPPSRVKKAQRALLPPFLCYGTVGLSLWENPDDSQQQDFRVTLPWQLTPIPTQVATPSQIHGLLIRRRVPVEEVKRMFRGAAPKRGALGEAQRTTVARGDLPGDIAEVALVGHSIDAFLEDGDFPGTGRQRANGSDAGKTDQMDVLWLGNCFLWDEKDYLTEQIVFVGDKLYFREGFTLARRCRPVTTIHSIDVGGFYGRSWMELQIPLNSELEGAIGRSFQNVRELDLYGTTLVPTNFGLTRNALVTAKDGRKFQPYEWDQLTPANQNVIQLQPFNSGGFPVQMVKIGTELSDRLANQPQAMMRGDAPGRMDSAAGLGTLIETSNVPLSPDAAAIAEGFSDIYRAALSKDLTTWSDQDVVAVTMLDDSLAGIVYDPKQGTIALADNPIAHPDEVDVTVQSMMPISKSQQILELKDHLRAGLITPMQYRIKARIMNLDLPVSNEQEWESYKKARLENILLYHDGQSVPEGPEDQVGVLFSAEGDLHPVHILVHMELVATVKFSMAAPVVRQRILDHIDRHKTDGMGRAPEGMPPLEEAAEQTLMMPLPGALQG